MLLLKVILLVALVKAQITYDKPFLLAGIYTLFYVLLMLASLAAGQVMIVTLFLAGLIAMLASSVYFFLLHLTQESALWWLVMVLGIFLLL